jgi:hypothetical protein
MQMLDQSGAVFTLPAGEISSTASPSPSYPPWPPYTILAMTSPAPTQIFQPLKPGHTLTKALSSEGSRPSIMIPSLTYGRRPHFVSVAAIMSEIGQAVASVLAEDGVDLGVGGSVPAAEIAN